MNVDEVHGSSAPETGVVNRADLDEVFLEEWILMRSFLKNGSGR